MAPKLQPTRKRKTQGESSRQQAAFNADLFLSAENEKRLNEFLCNWGFVPERGIILNNGDCDEIFNQILRRNWAKLCKLPVEGSASIVREFYANAFRSKDDDRNKFESYVRGRRILFDARTLDRFLETPEAVGDCGYTTLKREALNPGLILSTICRQGAQWELDSGGYPKFLKKSDLLPIPKAWCTFCEAGFFPNSHHQEVTRGRALLIFAIVTGRSVDVGLLISRNIQTLAQSRTRRSRLWYPSLITQLCQAAGVVTSGDVSIRPAPAVDVAMINRYLQEDDPAQIPPVARARAARPPRPRPEPSSSGVERRLRRIETYMVQSNQALEMMMRNLAVQLNVDPDALGSIPLPAEETESEDGAEAGGDDSDGSDD